MYMKVVYRKEHEGGLDRFWISGCIVYILFLKLYLNIERLKIFDWRVNKSYELFTWKMSQIIWKSYEKWVNDLPFSFLIEKFNFSLSEFELFELFEFFNFEIIFKIIDVYVKRITVNGKKNVIIDIKIW
jgi:hypothetical protein